MIIALLSSKLRTISGSVLLGSLPKRIKLLCEAVVESVIIYRLSELLPPTKTLGFRIYII